MTLDGLDPAFTTALDALLADCASAGVIMRPYFGVRDPVTQGKLWRQSRLTSDINAEIAKLKAQGAPFLAQCIDRAGPANGSWATNAIPGLSWHQWGLAMDCEWVRDGKVSFDIDADGANNGYRVYAGKSLAHGLTNLGRIGDWGHVQFPPESSPLHRYTLQQIDEAMAAKFGSLTKEN